LSKNHEKAHEHTCLRDLVMDQAAWRGLAREKVWEWACLAIIRDELPVSLPDNASLDTRLGGTTWRNLLADAFYAAQRGRDPAKYGWTRAVMLSRATFGECLDQAQSALAPTTRSARQSQRRASRLQAALEALRALYPTAKPLGSVKTITAEVAEWLAKQNEHGVSGDTVSRALKVYQPQQSQN
jgi:hypothetical protein